ncbi:MAG: Trk system potassium transporter TrkA [Actinomycetota bacterium]|nr:Trk system potassium transporter TrkA [Actinomycetota bacterium]
MRIFVIGAGQVGTTIVEALHDEHNLTVFDLDTSRLSALSYRFDVATVEGDGASRRALQQAGIEHADLLIACTSRDETNVIAALFARGLSRETKTIVRTTNVEYLDVWRERELDVDFIVSSELETAHAVSRTIGVPAARQTDVFADGQVQIVEFDVESGTGRPDVIGPALRDAYVPPDSKVASIIRGGEMIVPRGDQAMLPGDRIIVIGSPEAAREWSAILAPKDQRVASVVIYGGGRTGAAIAEMLLQQGIEVRIIEADRARAMAVSERLPKARTFHATGLDPEFLERERIGASQAGIFAMRDDAKNHYAATLAKLHGVRFTIAIVHDAVSVEVFERAGIDVAINPRLITAEEIVRFAHDPRTRQVAMLEGDRYEILDVTVRPESRLVGTPFRELPMTGALIGAIIRDGHAIFPHGDDALQPDDRVIVFTESRRAGTVEKAL